MTRSLPWLGFMLINMTPITAVPEWLLRNLQRFKDLLVFMADFRILLGCKKFLSLEQDSCRVMASPPSYFCICKNES